MTNPIPSTLSLPPIELLGRYPYTRNQLTVHFMPDKAMVFWKATGDSELSFNGEGSGYLPLEFARFLPFVDGKTNLNDIILAYCERYQRDFFSLWTAALEFFQAFIHNGRLGVADAPHPGAVQTTGHCDYHIPCNLVVELTTRCNLHCSHCYCHSSPSRTETIPVSDLFRILDHLRQNGLRAIELTGGEPLLHPDFPAIVEFCAARFSPFGILTNGTRITESLADQFARHKERLIFNISLDSSRPENHDRIRGVPGSWRKTVMGIRRLSERGIMVRVAMCVHESTVDDIEATLLLARSLGARWFSHNTVSPWGRGKSTQWEMSRVQREILLQEFEKLKQEKYADMTTFIPKPALDSIIENGCGAGFTSFILGARGDIRPCVILDENYLTFGNLFQQSMEEVFNSPTARRWRTLRLPTRDLCGDCHYQSYCQYCIAKGIMLNESFPEGCRWARHYHVPGGGRVL
ncbi:MAG TPA: radical SAM protein [bacterium]|nr:radical SAM protein [bacterium]